MQKWQCTVCGYIHTGSKPPEKCPVCGSDASLFVALESSDAPPAASPSEAPAIQSGPQGGAETGQWRCSVCGYNHTGASAPLACPVCGADQDRYSAVAPSGPVAAKAGATPHSAEANAKSTTVPEMPAAADKSAGRREWILDKMVDLHAHPIAVHIPNGVLPIAVIFLLLGTVFHSRTLSTAAYYNLIFIALAMPLVLFSGYNDWQRRFGGHLTRVFLTKMTCGGIVFIGVSSGVIWRLFDPQVALPGAPARWTYLLLHLVVLAAAIVAGFYGGKLVIFPQKQR